MTRILKIDEMAVVNAGRMDALAARRKAAFIKHEEKKKAMVEKAIIDLESIMKKFPKKDVIDAIDTYNYAVSLEVDDSLDIGDMHIDGKTLSVYFDIGTPEKSKFCLGYEYDSNLSRILFHYCGGQKEYLHIRGNKEKHIGAFKGYLNALTCDDESIRSRFVKCDTAGGVDIVYFGFLDENRNTIWKRSDDVMKAIADAFETIRVGCNLLFDSTDNL